MPIVQSVPTVSIGTGFPDSTSPATPKSEMILPPQKRTFETNLTSNLYHLEPSRRGSLSTPFSNGEVLHLLVLANPCLDVIDDTVELLLFSGVTHDPGHQDSFYISERFLSQSPVTWEEYYNVKF